MIHIKKDKNAVNKKKDIVNRYKHAYNNILGKSFCSGMSMQTTLRVKTHGIDTLPSITIYGNDNEKKICHRSKLS